MVPNPLFRPAGFFIVEVVRPGKSASGRGAAVQREQADLRRNAQAQREAAPYARTPVDIEAHASDSIASRYETVVRAADKGTKQRDLPAVGMSAEHEIRKRSPVRRFLRMVFKQNAEASFRSALEGLRRLRTLPAHAFIQIMQSGYDQRCAADVEYSMFIAQDAEAQFAETGQPVFQTGVKIVIARAGMDAAGGAQLRQRFDIFHEITGMAVHEVSGQDNEIRLKRIDSLHHVPNPGAGDDIADMQIGKLDDAQTVKGGGKTRQGDDRGNDLRSSQRVARADPSHDAGA